MYDTDLVRILCGGKSALRVTPKRPKSWSCAAGLLDDTSYGIDDHIRALQRDTVAAALGDNVSTVRREPQQVLL